MPMVMNMACVNMRMTMKEALVAATINAAGIWDFTFRYFRRHCLDTSCVAGSLNKSATHGSLEPGKVGDLLILNANRWEHLIYQLVDPPIETVVKKGCVVRG